MTLPRGCCSHFTQKAHDDRSDRFSERFEMMPMRMKQQDPNYPMGDFEVLKTRIKRQVYWNESLGLGKLLPLERSHVQIMM